jgi:hypothetical protein
MPSLMAVLGLNINPFKEGMKEALAEGEKGGFAIMSALGPVAGGGALAGLAAEVVTKFNEAGKQLDEFAERTVNLADRLGISTEAEQAWNYALERSGASMESAVGFFEKLAGARKKALAGKDEFVSSFKALGVSIDDLKTKRLEDVALQISKVFEAGDPQKLIADLREIGGRGAGELVAAFRSGLGDLVVGAKDMGIVIEDDTLRKLKEMNEEMKQIELRKQAMEAPFHLFVARIKESRRQLFGAWMASLGAVSADGSIKTAIRDYFDELARQKAQGEARAAQRAAVGATGLEDSAAGGKGDLKKAEQLAKERERLEERLADMQSKHYLASLTKEQQITELHRRRAELGYWLASNWEKLSDLGRLKAQIDVEDLKGEEESTKRSLDKPHGSHRAHQLSVNALQGIGAYASGPSLEQRALQTHEKNGQHLARMEKTMEKVEQHLANGRDHRAARA